MQFYSIQVDRNLAESAQSVLQELGSDITSAVTTFLRQTVREREIPGQADPTLFTEEELMEKHRRGLREIDAGYGICKTMRELEAMANGE